VGCEGSNSGYIHNYIAMVCPRLTEFVVIRQETEMHLSRGSLRPNTRATKFGVITNVEE